MPKKRALLRQGNGAFIVDKGIGWIGIAIGVIAIIVAAAIATYVAFVVSPWATRNDL